MSALEIGIFIAFTGFAAFRMFLLKKLLQVPDLAPVRGGLVLRHFALAIFFMCIALHVYIPSDWNGVWFDLSAVCLLAYALSFFVVYFQRHRRKKA
ncbi:MAG: hypothetical protein M1453_13310 [Acidobacteria bacterium]|nr:hypothetical protein [Acidobacteriota bacterium]MCL5288956.1 hypothetical protein [Acidobacteriota bacterium]